MFSTQRKKTSFDVVVGFCYWSWRFIFLHQISFQIDVTQAYETHFSSDLSPKICFCSTFKLHLADLFGISKASPTRCRAERGPRSLGVNEVCLASVAPWRVGVTVCCLVPLFEDGPSHASHCLPHPPFREVPAAICGAHCEFQPRAKNRAGVPFNLCLDAQGTSHLWLRGSLFRTRAHTCPNILIHCKHHPL